MTNPSKYDLLPLLSKYDKAVIESRKANSIDTSYFLIADMIMAKIVEKAFCDDKTLVELINWLEEKTGTLSLREMCEKVGYEYLDNNCYDNAINLIDTIQTKLS